MSRAPGCAALRRGLAVAVLVGLLLHPLGGGTGETVPGDPGTDALRGAWGLDHLWRALPPGGAGWWSAQVWFPYGALLVPLPGASAALLSPVSALLGPAAGAWAALAVQLWLLGFGAATLAAATTRRASVGLAAAGLVLGAPAIHAAWMDGTPEHLAWGLLPLGLAALVRARSRAPGIAGLGAAALLAVVPFDSPYAAVYAVPLGAAALATAGPRARAPVGVALLGALLGVLTFAALRHALGHPPSPPGLRAAEWATNAVHPLTCLDAAPRPRAPGTVPAAPPAAVLGAITGLVLLGIRRGAAPWALAAAAMALAAFGLHPALESVAPLRLVHAANAALHELPGFGEIRFPRRWWAPATLAAALAAGPGLARALRRLPRRAEGPVGLALGAAALLAGARHSGVWAPFPAAPLSAIAAADWIAAQPTPGAVLTLPHAPPPAADPARAPRPFGGIATPTVGADTLQLQLRHRRPILDGPALWTAAPLRIDLGLHFALRSLDALALPVREGRPIPPSARTGDGPLPRAAAIAALHAQGLRFVVIDRALYAGEGEALVGDAFAPWTAQVVDFADGEGLRVIRLRD